MDNEYVSILRKKLDILMEEKDQKTKEIKILMNSIEVIQKSIDSILQLLQIEGVSLNNQVLGSASLASISDSAYEYLRSSTEKKPMHYMDLFNGLAAAGKSIPGKNPPANLLTHISRDNRFVRVSPGTYGLSDWGIQASKIQKRKKARKNVRK